ncbi:hypothetical protein AVEN_115868-1 [Araneus ventricosus]|uniref:Tc1-like transposase DDE domain-containing protein n=1 Tax=Araneus ventricosus TaxID=182803 RepID=A0A4Y2D0Z7_ARAVE|nr:hypothetical protein AVEN_18798-1 [Araneus ventricosus]GBM10070.1 hypothetical protein AVEN_115868-1 [Araneus ventricosus]
MGSHVAMHGRKRFPDAVVTTQNTRKTGHEKEEKKLLLFLVQQKCWEVFGWCTHYRNGVHRHLNARYGQQWIGRGGPVLWPARSPDLTCLDYFLWGYVKSLVYETPVNSAEDLVAGIAAAAGEVRDTPGILANDRSSIRRRCEACITARGRNFEHLL